MGEVLWDAMAEKDLREATNEREVWQEFLSLAATELRYPPRGGADEGYAAQYDRGFAYRRAVRRAAPSKDADLASDPITVDGDGFPYGRYYYVYRPRGRATNESGEGEAAPLVVHRLLRDSAMYGQLPAHGGSAGR